MEAAITPPETFPHPDDAREYPRYGHPDAEVEQAIRSLLDLMGESDIDDVVREILVTGLKLIDDQATRGDVKLMNSALKELRHASRVFAPYRDRRKITIFGSARTPEDRPEYRMAVDFGRRAARAGFMVITGAGDGIMKAGHEGAGREASFGVNIRLPFHFVEGRKRGVITTIRTPFICERTGGVVGIRRGHFKCSFQRYMECRVA